MTDIALVAGNRIRCQYKNIGDAEIPEQDVWIEMYADEARFSRSSIGVGRSFAAGKGGWLETNAPPDRSGSVSIRCVIDARNNVDEADEGNNQLFRVLTLP